MSKVISFITTFVLLLLISLGITKISNYHFVDVAFYVGLAGFALISITNYSGGLISNAVNRQIQGETGVKIKRDEMKHRPTTYPLLASIIYLLGAIINIVIVYKDYF